jgi:hypothetical protein
MHFLAALLFGCPLFWLPSSLVAVHFLAALFFWLLCSEQLPSSNTSV